MSCPLRPNNNNYQQQQQEEEWNDIAGEWDDLATIYNRKLFQYLILQQQQQVPSKNLPIQVLPNPMCSTMNRDETIQNSSCIIRIIDFGCGTGLFIEHIVQYYHKLFIEKKNSHHHHDQNIVQQQQQQHVHILGIDTSIAMIHILQEKIRNYGWNDESSSSNDSITVTAIAANLYQCNKSNNEKDSIIPPISNDTKPQPQQLQTLLNDDWYGNVDVIFANSVISYLPITTTTTAIQEPGVVVSELEGTINVFSKLLKPTFGYFIHADWTNIIIPPPPSSSSSNLLSTLTNNNNNTFDDDATTTTTTNSIITTNPTTHLGILHPSDAQKLYSIIQNNSNGMEMIHIESVEFPNVYHYHHNTHHDKGSNVVLIGIARRRPI